MIAILLAARGMREHYGAGDVAPGRVSAPTRTRAGRKGQVAMALGWRCLPLSHEWAGQPVGFRGPPQLRQATGRLLPGRRRPDRTTHDLGGPAGSARELRRPVRSRQAHRKTRRLLCLPRNGTARLDRSPGERFQLKPARDGSGLPAAIAARDRGDGAEFCSLQCRFRAGITQVARMEWRRVGWVRQ